VVLKLQTAIQVFYSRIRDEPGVCAEYCQTAGAFAEAVIGLVELIVHLASPQTTEHSADFQPVLLCGNAHRVQMNFFQFCESRFPELNSFNLVKSSLTSFGENEAGRIAASIVNWSSYTRRKSLNKSGASRG
jgi:hypothetical protein